MKIKDTILRSAARAATGKVVEGIILDRVFFRMSYLKSPIFDKSHRTSALSTRMLLILIVETASGSPDGFMV